MGNGPIRASLRGRYLLAAVVVVCGLIVAVVFSSYHVDRAEKDVLVNDSIRDSLIRSTQQARGAIWSARSSLAAFLLTPNTRLHDETLAYFNQAEREVAELTINVASIKQLRVAGLLGSIADELTSIAESARKLMAIRVEAEEQYPGIRIMRQEMLPRHNDFLATSNLLISELDSQGDANDHDVYQTVIALRYSWSHMIANFRLYLANRLGGLDIERLANGEREVYQSVDVIKRLLQDLITRNAKHDFSLSSTDLLNTLSDDVNSWMRGFEELRALHASDKWRVDVMLLRDQIHPSFQRLWYQFDSLDKTLAAWARHDNETQRVVTNTTEQMLFLFALAVILLIGAGYRYLSRMVIAPFESMARALKAEANNVSDVALPQAATVESLELIDAFEEMRKQVHHRQKALEHQALHDTLTGLPNRQLLSDRIEQAIRYAHRGDAPFALIMMDLNHFKDVNDTLGHQVGDQLLQQLGTRLVGALRESDTVARLGGDEFAILVLNTDAAQIMRIIDKISHALHAPFLLENRHIKIGASQGIAFFPEHGVEALDLMRHADVAMYTAKYQKEPYAFYASDQEHDSVDRLVFWNEMQEAIEESRFHMNYQPKYDIRDKRIVGVEALLRWNHPRRGPVSPMDIVAAAEQSGHIRPLTRWVLQQALGQLRQWHDSEIELSLAVNISAINLLDTDLPGQVESALSRSGIAPHHLTLELTETAMMTDPDQAAVVLGELRELGVLISVDDYGAGFSNLFYLKRLPVNELKIDQSFVSDMLHDEHDAVIVRSTIDLAHNLGLSVIAEGVENQDILDVLEILGCDQAQGFHISRPLMADQLAPVVSAGSRCEPAK